MDHDALGLNDRRSFERFTARYPTRLKDSRENFGSKMTLCNASAEGTQITSKDQFFLHDSLTLEVDLPDGKHPTTMKGQVVWTRQNELNDWDIGIKFHNISLMHLSRLYSLATAST